MAEFALALTAFISTDISDGSPYAGSLFQKFLEAPIEEALDV